MAHKLCPPLQESCKGGLALGACNKVWRLPVAKRCMGCSGFAVWRHSWIFLQASVFRFFWCLYVQQAQFLPVKLSEKQSP